jgi:hypothetical protein
MNKKIYTEVILSPSVIILQYMEKENNFFYTFVKYTLHIKVFKLVYLIEMLIRHFSSFLCFPDLDSYHRIF